MLFFLFSFFFCYKKIARFFQEPNTREKGEKKLTKRMYFINMQRTNTSFVTFWKLADVRIVICYSCLRQNFRNHRTKKTTSGRETDEKYESFFTSGAWSGGVGRGRQGPLNKIWTRILREFFARMWMRTGAVFYYFWPFMWRLLQKYSRIILIGGGGGMSGGAGKWKGNVQVAIVGRCFFNLRTLATIYSKQIDKMDQSKGKHSAHGYTVTYSKYLCFFFYLCA